MTVESSLMRNAQKLCEPLQVAPQPTNLHPAAACAVSATASPSVYTCLHVVAAQASPVADVTVPAPSTEIVSDLRAR